MSGNLDARKKKKDSMVLTKLHFTFKIGGLFSFYCFKDVSSSFTQTAKTHIYIKQKTVGGIYFYFKHLNIMSSI